MMIERVQNENHALLVGNLFGAMMRVASEESEGHTRCEFIDFEDGAHAATFRVVRPSGAYLVSVVPEERA